MMSHVVKPCPKSAFLLVLALLSTPAAAQEGEEGVEGADMTDAASERAAQKAADASEEPQPLPESEAIPTSRPAGVPDDYVIQAGDTLWDICARILGDPFQWPKLWSLNQYITNPHWIYPGNVLRFYEGTTTTPPRFEVRKPGDDDAPSGGSGETSAGGDGAESDGPGEGTFHASDATVVPGTITVEPKGGNLDQAATAALGPTIFDINLRDEGFISADRIPPLGTVSASFVAVAELAEGHEVYLKVDSSAPLRIGRRYTIFRQLRSVRHPIKGTHLGHMIKLLGEVEIVKVLGDIATAKILSSYDGIVRGDPVTEFIPVLKQVQPAPASGKLNGYIVASVKEGVDMIGTRDIICIDLGSADGVQIGNSFEVIRSGDGLLGPRSDLPNEVVGHMVVIGTREHTSTAVITDTGVDLRTGDRIRTTEPNP